MQKYRSVKMEKYAMKVEIGTKNIRRLAICLIGLFMLTAAPDSVVACAPYCNDPNWQHQERVMRDQAEQQRQQAEQYGQSAAPGVVLTPPPGYEKPRPPKGWQPRWTGFTRFAVGISADEDSESDNLRYDYALAMNFPSESEAREAAESMCRVQVVPLRNLTTNADYCEIRTETASDPFLKIGVQTAVEQLGYLDLSVGISRDHAFYADGMVYQYGSKFYACGSLHDPSPSTCGSWMLALARNGSHQQPAKAGEFTIYPCPSGPADAYSKVVGLDMLSGKEVPVCGPDIVKLAMQDQAGKWDAYASHPRYVLPFAAGGFADVAAAQKAVLKICDDFTGGGCQLVGQHKDAVVVTLRNNEAKFFLGTGASEAEAMADASRRCNPGQLLPCKKVLTRIAGDARVYTPQDRSSHLRYFGAVALPNGIVGADNKAWTAQDVTNQADADRYVLQACQSQNIAKSPCTIVGRGLGVTFVGYSGLDGSRGVLTVLARDETGYRVDHDRVELAVKAHCDARGTLCKKGNYRSGSSAANPDVDLDTMDIPKM
jgi:hypothetical protein